MRQRTRAEAVVIRVPPAAPIVMTTSPEVLLTIMDGHIEESGRFLGFMKLASDGITPNVLTSPGVEKSSISLLNAIPVFLPRTLDPKLKEK